MIAYHIKTVLFIDSRTWDYYPQYSDRGSLRLKHCIECNNIGGSSTHCSMSLIGCQPGWGSGHDNVGARWTLPYHQPVPPDNPDWGVVSAMLEGWGGGQTMVGGGRDLRGITWRGDYRSAIFYLISYRSASGDEEHGGVCMYRETIWTRI